jgi:hypothetical protein
MPIRNTRSIDLRPRHGIFPLRIAPVLLINNQHAPRPSHLIFTPTSTASIKHLYYTASTASSACLLPHCLARLKRIPTTLSRAPQAHTCYTASRASSACLLHCQIQASSACLLHCQIQASIDCLLNIICLLLTQIYAPVAIESRMHLIDAPVTPI